MVVAALARGNTISPYICSPLGEWNDVITGQLVQGKRIATVETDLPVSAKQFEVAERRGKRA